MNFIALLVLSYVLVMAGILVQAHTFRRRLASFLFLAGVAAFIWLVLATVQPSRIDRVFDAADGSEITGFVSRKPLRRSRCYPRRERSELGMATSLG
jgi:hypothetical protein